MAQDLKASPDRTGKGTNAQQVRDDIDAGRMRDKVDHPDPATAPLGTDAEAGGAPASIQSTRADHEPHADARRAQGGESRNVARPGLITVVVAIVVAAGIIWYFAGA